MRRFALAVIVCALLGAWSAAPAGAHWGRDDGMSCAGITLQLAGFPAGENTVTTAILIDGAPIDPVASTFEGPAATVVVPLPPFTGTHVVRYQTSWAVDGGGQTPAAETTISCGGDVGAAAPQPVARTGWRHAWHRWRHRCARSASGERPVSNNPATT